ncbi:formamidopyrimidine-DNA glycosylase [Spiroplasma sabaudiense Ar-1343]|uniref:Formamidopyrimidine-DNA glycosylase n=1 Tax=Spiroplasma sabaudiense Ar-1343 TaxID=1276257 RepID=W6AAJ9_9MOLU|nr:DNA-formamidopyrimidine glycosylase [Spiroplasma sabaudiense]AHI54087.1 formamidopyrimidine-DNA glycosylase [Spiroplasma sabaudiense Ar-1343]
MPELPEVETVVRTLRKLVLNKKITKAKIVYPNLLKQPTDTQQFESEITGQKILAIERIAKHIIFVFQNKVLISHLRMEGKWFFEPEGAQTNIKHQEAYFIFDDGMQLAYYDTRKFGTLHWQDIDNFREQKPLVTLGPEPFSELVTPNYLAKRINKSSKHIKTILLDQTIISGIGNIYDDEILFAAKIHPLKLGADISQIDFENIIDSSRDILAKSVEMGGTTIDSYQSAHGIDGKFQNFLKVHTRVNKPCLECQTLITKIKVNGRGTYFCPQCQVL